MNIFRIVIGLWGLACLVLVCLGALSYPLIKLPTPIAIMGIESNYVQLESLSDEELESYQFNKAWVLGNYNGLKEAAKIRQKYLTIIGIFTALLSFICAAFLPRITKPLNTLPSVARRS